MHNQPTNDQLDHEILRLAHQLHWYVGFRRCVACKQGFNHPAHYMAQEHRRVFGRWV